MAKPQYTKPTDQIELERRLKGDYVPSSVLLQGTDPDVSDNGYVGVSPEYQTYANETEAPLKADGVVGKAFDEYLSDDVDFTKAATDDGQRPTEEEQKEKEDEQSTKNPTKPSPTAPSTPTPNPGS